MTLYDELQDALEAMAIPEGEDVARALLRLAARHDDPWIRALADETYRIWIREKED